MTSDVRTHLGVDYDDSGKAIIHTNDLVTGATYEVVFGCVDEQRQTRGGLDGYGEHVVNIKKIDALFDQFKKLTENSLGNRNGLVLHSKYVLGGEYGFKGHYVHYKVDIRQTMKSMWDYSAEPLIEEFIEKMNTLGEFKHLTTISKDRTETILNALEYGKDK